MCMFLIAIALMVVAGSATMEHQSFEFFKKAQNKRYPTPAEEHARLAIFTENMKTAQQLEAQNPQAKFGASPFAS